jgi:hypothetical protein
MLAPAGPPGQPPATPPPAKPDVEPLWNVFGLRVGRKTEIIALVAFVLSVSGVCWQVFNYTRGAVVRLFPTDQIVFTASEALGRNYAGESNMLALIVSMSYVNDGETGHNAIIRREYVSISIGGRDIEHRWYEFGSSDVENSALKFKRDSEARPFPATAASATSHETLFAPWEIDCSQAAPPCDPGKNFITWADFISAIKTDPRIAVTTRADVYPSKKVAASCAVRLRDWEIGVLERDHWLSAACVDTTASDEPQRKVQSTKTPAANK